ncbi:AEC family transporter [Acetivibrio straminisolvens]|jgi:predicted permease|uniref:Malate permease n=1 Tax=Acetivibrio straminisolvens JCM 21531 TaxID=1294263 RepID=W4V8L1_9FIRM|nr:AEC family transporter [Acetivibrio straminisolvens]GAE89730.1 malate permease [Acetivibrio straminisolvens JCM 21531]
MIEIQSLTAQIQILINQISILVIMGLIGFIAGKTRYLPDNSGTVLSRTVIKLTAPLLIFTTLAGRNFTKDILINGMFIFLLGAVFIMFSFVLGHFTGKILGLEGATKNVYKMHFMFGNVIYLAFPLLRSLYGDGILIYAVFFNLANDAILWTLGIFLVNRHKKVSVKENLKHLINANTIAFTAGLVIMLIKSNFKGIIDSIPYIYDIGGFISNAFIPIGEATVPLSMLFIGLILSETKISSAKDLIKRYPIFILALFKLILIPCIALFVFSFIDFVDPLVKAVIILQLSMPCGTIVPALAEQYGSDYRIATENVFITTLLGIVTMPLVVYLLSLIG